MTAAKMLAVFEDFNDPRDEPPPPAPEPLGFAANDIGRIREEAWTEGYMTGRQQTGAVRGDETLTAKLLTSVHQLESETSEVVDAAALLVADLLVSTVVTVTSDELAARLLGRVRMVADWIKPVLAVTPEFVIHDAAGSTRRFGDISALSHALDGGDIDQDVSIRWQRGEATISRESLLEDLREAIVPLSAGLTIEHSRSNQNELDQSSTVTGI
jgi:hypothetical protein